MRHIWTLLAFAPLALTACRGNPDRQLEDRVVARLATEQQGASVAVSVDGRIVELSGVVSSEAERTQLENAVRHVPGVLGVANQLVVQEPVTTTGALTTRQEVERAVAASVDAQLDAAGFPGLRVTVQDGVVRVSGTVPFARHDEALRIAREAAPAHRVDDETVVQ